MGKDANEQCCSFILLVVARQDSIPKGGHVFTQWNIRRHVFTQWNIMVKVQNMRVLITCRINRTSSFSGDQCLSRNPNAFSAEANPSFLPPDWSTTELLLKPHFANYKRESYEWCTTQSLHGSLTFSATLRERPSYNYLQSILVKEGRASILMCYTTCPIILKNRQRIESCSEKLSQHAFFITNLTFEKVGQWCRHGIVVVVGRSLCFFLPAFVLLLIMLFS